MSQLNPSVVAALSVMDQGVELTRQSYDVFNLILANYEKKLDDASYSIALNILNGLDYEPFIKFLSLLTPEMVTDHKALMNMAMSLLPEPDYD